MWPRLTSTQRTVRHLRGGWRWQPGPRPSTPIICDLCSSEHDDQSDLTPIYLDKPQSEARGMRGRRYQIDVCEGCLSRPIADVIAFCNGERPGEVKPASKRGVVRIAER
jgi:hypothetical protein